MIFIGNERYYCVLYDKTIQNGFKTDNKRKTKVNL